MTADDRWGWAAQRGSKEDKIERTCGIPAHAMLPNLSQVGRVRLAPGET